MTKKNAEIYIAGDHGMADSTILYRLKEESYHNFILKTSEK